VKFSARISFCPLACLNTASPMTSACRLGASMRS
jgi:hypothetical protein